MLVRVFQDLVTRIQPLEGELQRAANHSESIKRRLKGSFRLKNFLIVGSHARASAIRNASDLDILALFSRDELRWGNRMISSSTMLGRICTDLGQRFPQTGIGRDGQVVRIGFGQGSFAVDVIPAFYVEQHRLGWPVFGIPDGAGGWMRTAPTFHTRYLQGENQTTGGKLRVASQLLKYWSQLRSTTTGISSFHLEMLLASEKICTGVISYRTILALAFQSLASRKCAALRDPIGVAGLIPLIGSPGKRALAYTAVLSAAAHARNAVMCEQEQNSREAYRQWDIVFNHMLPR